MFCYTWLVSSVVADKLLMSPVVFGLGGYLLLTFRVILGMFKMSEEEVP